MTEGVFEIWLIENVMMQSKRRGDVQSALFGFEVGSRTVLRSKYPR